MPQSHGPIAGTAEKDFRVEGRPSDFVDGTLFGKIKLELNSDDLYDLVNEAVKFSECYHETCLKTKAAICETT